MPESKHSPYYVPNKPVEALKDLADPVAAQNFIPPKFKCRQDAECYQDALIAAMGTAKNVAHRNRLIDLLKISILQNYV